MRKQNGSNKSTGSYIIWIIAVVVRTTIYRSDKLDQNP